MRNENEKSFLVASSRDGIQLALPDYVIHARKSKQKLKIETRLPLSARTQSIMLHKSKQIISKHKPGRFSVHLKAKICREIKSL